MARVITFRMSLEGDKKSTDGVKFFGAELEKAVAGLEKFGQRSMELDKVAKRAINLAKELKKVNDQVKELGGKIALGKISTENLKKAAADYEQLVARANELRGANESVVQELRLLQRAAKEGAGRTDLEYQKLVARVAELKAGQNQVTNEIRQQTRAFEAQKFAAGSYRELNAQLGDLRASYRNLSKEARESIAGQEQLRAIKKLDKELKSLDKTMGISVRNVGNYRDAVRGLNNLIAGFTGFALFGVGAQEIVEANAKISDSIADVRKTTQLSTGALEGYEDVVVNLTNSLAQLDTRTSLADLLDISRIGGQLGVGAELITQFEELKKAGDEAGAALKLQEAQAELEGFTQAIDQVNVALGDELAGGVEGISSDLGKLNELLGSADEFGTGEGILAIGSAINSLGAAGTANGAKIVDFSKRLAGIAPQANISAANLLGLGAALDEFGQSPEVAASSLTQLLVAIGEDVPHFAAIAGKSVEEFSETLGVDGNEALLQVLEGAGAASGGIEDMARLLQEFGVDSVRATSVLTALTGNLQRVKDVQAIANEQFDIARGTMEGNLSVTEEFNVKNQTLAAEIDKLKNSFINLVVDSGFQEFLAAGVKGLVTFVQGLKAVPEFLVENRGLILALGGALITFNAAAIAAKVALLGEAIALKASAVAKKIATVSQWNLNAAMSANPIGVVIGLIALLVGGIIWLADNFDAVKETIVGAWQRVKEFGEGTGFLNKVVFALTAQIRAAIFVVQNFGAIWAGVKAAATQAIDNIVANFKSLAIEAAVLQLKLEKAFTFDADADAAIQSQIDALKAAQREIEKEAQPIATAFASAYTQAQQEARAAALAEEQAAQQERKEQAAADGAETGQARAEAEADAEEEEKKKRRQNETQEERKEREKKAARAAEAARKAEEKRQEEIAKARLEGAKRLAKLEAQVAGDETAIKGAEAAAQAGIDIGSAVGDPGQIVQQTQLIRAQLAQSLEEIYGDARESIFNKAQEQVDEIGEGGGLLPSPAAIQEAADEISATIEAEQAKLFEQQEQRLESSANAQIAALVGDPETVKEQADAIRAQLTTDLAAIDAQRDQFADEQAAKELERQQKVRGLQLEALEQQFMQEETARARQLQQRIAAIGEQVEAQIIGEQEAQEMIQEAREEAKDAELEALQALDEEKAALLMEGSADLIALQADMAQREIDIQQNKVDKMLEQEERLKKGRQAATQAGLGVLSDLIKGTQDLLGRDEENRKKHGAKLKALSLAEVAINLIREISSINASNSVYPEPLGSIIKGATIAKAIITAGVAVAKIQQTEFEYGGELQSAGAPYRAADGRIGVGGTNTPTRQRSASQGSAAVPGSLLAASVDGAMAGPAVHDGLAGYRPAGSVYVVGTGYVPEQGIIAGAPHSQGGVQVVNEHGALVELEGGEFLLRNGREVYVINKRSTRLYRQSLVQLTKGSSAYSPQRKLLASRINVAGGGVPLGIPGRKMQEGGALVSSSALGDSPASALATTILQPPVPAVDTNAAAQTELLEELRTTNSRLEGNIMALEAKVDAIQSQVINLRLISDPKEMVEEGLRQINEEEESGF